MPRRGNKSSKVPGVKLRPPQPQSSRRADEPHAYERLWAEETQLGSEDNVFTDTCPRPFSNIVICATGIQDKPALFKQAVELGATTTTSFTNRVNFLIAETHGGAKYKCALEHRIPIMQSSWITESYVIWLRGDDVDLNESIAQHRLPIFSGVVVALSGTFDIETQVRIRQHLMDHKGAFAEGITRPVKVTHLLCSGDEVTDKMRYAEKFNKRKEANIHLVWQEWFWDCVDFGGRFDESIYHLGQPRPQRNVPEPPGSSPPTTPVSPPIRAPIRRVTTHGPAENEDEEELASVNRAPAVTVNILQSLLKSRGYEVTTQGKLMKSPSKKDHPTNPSPERPPSPAGGSVLSKFRRANSFAVKEAIPQPFSQRSVSAPVPVASTKLFLSVKFCALGEAKSHSVKTAVEQAGGIMVAEEEKADYIIVRLASGSKLYRAEQDAHLRLKFRTECWLEQSIYAEKICAIDDHISFTPLSIDLPVPGAECIELSLSGLDEADRCFMLRIVRALGMTLAPGFSRKTTHLLCPSGTGNKYEKAKEWKIPVVNMGWLEAIVRSGMVPSITPYLVGIDPPHSLEVPMADGTAIFQKALENCAQSSVRYEPRAAARPSTTGGFVLNGLLRTTVSDPKGKGKAVDEPSAMMDITNDIDLEGSTTFARNLEARPQSSQRPDRAEEAVAMNNITKPAITDEEVPSSRTPSPMKLPSPKKMPPLLDMPKLNLLGKRRSEDSDERAERRQRPRALRPKPNSRPESMNDVIEAPMTSKIDGFDEGAEDEDEGGGVGQESMRVTYDDNDEKRKLMNLLAPKVPGGKCGGSAKHGARRSTRKSGGGRGS